VFRGPLLNCAPLVCSALCQHSLLPLLRPIVSFCGLAPPFPRRPHPSVFVVFVVLVEIVWRMTNFMFLIFFLPFLCSPPLLSFLRLSLDDVAELVCFRLAWRVTRSIFSSRPPGTIFDQTPFHDDIEKLLFGWFSGRLFLMLLSG